MRRCYPASVTSSDDTAEPWVEIASRAWLHEAAFIRSLLEAEGIVATIPNEHTLGVQPLYGNLLGGVRVLVRTQDVPRAREILQSAAVPPTEEGHNQDSCS
jgi:Putative prokaryotic signal transducing protein